MSQEPGLSRMDEIAAMFSVDDYMYFYSDYLDSERSSEETNAVVSLLEMNRPMRILDLACGFGRIANRLALLGHRVTGVEYQPGFISIARSAAEPFGILDARRGGSVHYEQGDMRQIEYEGQFDRAIMMFNSFGYFTDAENQEVMNRVSRALRPGGLLGMDIGSRDGLMANFQAHYVSEKEDSLMINRFSFDVLAGRLHNQRIIIRNGQRKDLPFSIRLYSVSEIRIVLAQAGLELQSIYGEWDGRTFDSNSAAMVIIARKVNP